MAGEKFDSVRQLIQDPESSEKEPRIAIVEIGAGMAPLLMNPPEDYAAHLQENKSLHYFAIDLDETSLRVGRENVIGTTRKPIDRVHYVRAKGQQLPFEDRSVAEVIFKNVMGGGTAYPKRLLTEAIRILKKGGVIKIIETYEPYVANESNGPLDYIRTRLTDALEEVPYAKGLTPVDEESMDRKFMSAESPVGRIGAPDRFVVYFKKITD